MLLLTIGFAGLSEAADPLQVTRSAGLQPALNGSSIMDKLFHSPAETFIPPLKTRSIEQAIATPTLQYRHPADTLPVSFILFDASAELSGDLDYDGYYHRIKISFDADVDSAQETVYAKLYLSHQGSAWKQYASSELFDIHYDDSADRYEIITELIEGYQPGYYEVLIELHSLHHSGIVASRIVQADDAGFVLSLEDLEHDESPGDSYYYSGYGVSGSFSWAGIVLLGILLLIKWRYFSVPQKQKALKLLFTKRGGR